MRLAGTRHLRSLLEHQFEHWGAEEGLFTVLICIPCLEVRLAQPDTLLGLPRSAAVLGAVGLSDQGLRPLVPRPLVSGGHTTAEHPGWTATYELLRPYPTQRQRVVYRRSAPPAR